MQTILPVAQCGEAILTLIAAPISESEFGSAWLNTLADTMQDTMLERNGVGIAAGMEKKIFEVFQRAHSKQEYEGTGIGLAIVKKIITNHEGAIYAKCNEAQGTTFTILLPEK